MAKYCRYPLIVAVSTISGLLNLVRTSLCLTLMMTAEALCQTLVQSVVFLIPPRSFLVAFLASQVGIPGWRMGYGQSVWFIGGSSHSSKNSLALGTKLMSRNQFLVHVTFACVYHESSCSVSKLICEKYAHMKICI